MGERSVSVLVLGWNSRALAPEALASALAQTTPPREVVLLDNASTDGGPDEVARRFGARVRIVRFAENLGYTGAYNRGIAEARDDVLLLLNPDVRLKPDFLERALPAFDDPRVGIVAGRLLRLDERTVDSSGQFLARSRRPLDRGYGLAFDPRRDAAGPVLAACGAAALYRRAMVDDIADNGEFFDPDYFAFTEDLEIGWRAWRAGWTAVHVPEAVAIHLRAGGAAATGRRLAFARSPDVTTCVIRNRHLAILRHDRVGALLRDLPFVLGRDAALALLVLIRRPSVFVRVWRSRAAYSRALQKRRRDRERDGVWGRWRAGTPPRGCWTPWTHPGGGP